MIDALRAIALTLVAGGVAHGATADGLVATGPDRVSIDTRATAHPLPHFWETGFGSGRAVLTLRDSYRRDLKSVHTATNFRYVRFHEIFHDDLGVYDEDTAGNAVYNFTLVDQIYDGLLARGVRPLVELGFMPKKLAARLDLHAFWDKPVVSPPKDANRWGELISAFAQHLVDRYGINEVAEWYFEVWNEPNIDFWTGDPKLETYLDLYAHTARALKSVSPRLRVGGPATAAAHWIPEFLQYAQANGLPVDFVSTHGYADDTEEDLFGNADPVPVDLRVCRAVAKVRHEIDASPRPGLPLFWTEWNVPSFGDGLKARDTAYVGAGVAETVRQCDGLVQMLAYWTFSDVFDENGPSIRPFTGSFGLIGVGGILKPSWTAFALLHRLGEERLANPSPGVLVTRRHDGTFATALWNLQDPGTPPSDRDVEMFITNHAATTPVWLTVIDERHGNSRAAYEAMGSPRYPSAAEVSELNRAAQIPARHPLRRSTDGIYRVHLSANALALVEFGPSVDDAPRPSVDRKPRDVAAASRPGRQ